MGYKNSWHCNSHLKYHTWPLGTGVHPGLNLRDMIDHSKEWARQRGLLQKNPVHGREKWKIPTERTFEFGNETEQTATVHGSAEVQDPPSKLKNLYVYRLYKSTLYLYFLMSCIPQIFTRAPLKDPEGTLLANDVNEEMAIQWSSCIYETAWNRLNPCLSSAQRGVELGNPHWIFAQVGNVWQDGCGSRQCKSVRWQFQKGRCFPSSPTQPGCL